MIESLVCKFSQEGTLAILMENFLVLALGQVTGFWILPGPNLKLDKSQEGGMNL